MNGFTNAILSLLLGWIRLLINQFWKLINSDGGRSFFSFVADQWLVLLLALCVGGFIVDRIVYVLRWRPYYLWRGRRRRAKAYEAGDEPAEPYPSFDELADETPSYPAEQPTALYRRPRAAPAVPDAMAEATNRYAPSSLIQPSPYAAQAAFNAPPAELVFDDDPEEWAPGGMVKPLDGMAEVMADVRTDFGAARPEPAAYLRDMQAGFARPLSPEQIYSAPAAAPEPRPDALEARPAAPVHPGLDGERIRENVGLTPAGTLPGAEAVPTAAAYHAFAPFIPSDGEQSAQNRPRNPFSTLAKKARGLVGVGDEDDPRTIHDLQPTVDMRSAFHDPVYPKPRPAKEDDDLSTY